MSPDDFSLDPDQLRYRLLNPLAVIAARAQMVQRQMARSPGITETERQHLQTHFSAIHTATGVLTGQLDQLLLSLAERSRTDPAEKNDGSS